MVSTAAAVTTYNKPAYFRPQPPAFAPTASSPSLACPRYPIALFPASLSVDLGEVARRAASDGSGPGALPGLDGTGALAVARSAVTAVAVVGAGGDDVRRTGPKDGDWGSNSSYGGGGEMRISCERFWSCR